MKTENAVLDREQTHLTDLLTEVQRDLPALNVQDAFVVPTWFYRQDRWIQDSTGTENALYNFPVVVRITGALDLDDLGRSLGEVQRRHEVLRSIFRLNRGQVVQIIVSTPPVTLNVIDLMNIPQPQRDETLNELLITEAQRPFDLANEVVFRTSVYRVGIGEHVLLMNTHHLVCDDWSSGILVADLFSAYESAATGGGGRLPELSFRYSDFIRSQQALENAKQGRRESWKASLPKGKSFQHLPRDFSSNRGGRGATLSHVLPKTLVDGMSRVSRKHKVTLFMALLAAYECLLHAYSGETDVGVGTCAANRMSAEVEPLIGRFANDILVRTSFSGDPTFAEVLSRTRDAALDAYGNQDLPFGALLEEIAPHVPQGTTPLFQSTFIFQNAPKTTQRSGAVTFETVLLDTRRAKYDLAIWLRTEESIRVSFEYSPDVFREETIERMIKDYQAILELMVTSATTRVSTCAIGCASRKELAAGDNVQLIQTKVLKLWRDVLGLSEIQPTDDFFECGGDSLRAAQLLFRIRETFGAQLELASLFSFRTIEAQAAAIAQSTVFDGQKTASAGGTGFAAVPVCESAGRPVSRKSLIRRVGNRLLHSFARVLPSSALRVFLHRMRGVAIGKDVWIGDDVYLENEYPEYIEIQDGAMVGLRSTVLAHTRGAGRVVISRNAFIGAGAMIVTSGDRHVIIGEGAVIMASSLVSHSVAPYTLYGSDASRPLAKLTTAFTADTSYEELIRGIQPL